ncbi:MAG: protein kinase, partial [Polyangiales bacterium]
HLVLDQLVAIKSPTVDAQQQPLVAERFRREARAAARLQSAHACRVLDIGSHADSAYMVMEYLEGNALSVELERRGRLPWQEAFDCVLQACDAVSEAHACGIVHRDLKPSNLFWATLPDGSRHVKVLGFGVAKDQSASQDSALSVTSTLATTPVYMSPEQLDPSHQPDERTDIWSLAVVLYELISGRPPFQGGSLPGLVSSVLTASPRPLGELQVGVPAGLDTVLAKALSKQRERRYGSIAELVGALMPFFPDLAATAASGESAGAPVPLGGRTPQPRSQPSVPVLSSAGHRVARGAVQAPAAHSGSGLQGSGSQRGAAPVDQRTTRGDGARYGAALLVLALFIGLGFAVFQWRRAEERAGRSTGKPAPREGAAQPAAAVQETAAKPEAAPRAAQPPREAAPTKSAQPAEAAATKVAQPTAARPGAALGPSEPGPTAPPTPAALPAPKRRDPSPVAPPASRTADPRNAPEARPAQPQRDVSDFGGRR